MATKKAPEGLTAYCMKTKEKNVLMHNAVISQTSRGGYMAMGDDGNGNKMTTMLSKEKAEEALEKGWATSAETAKPKSKKK